MPHVAFYRLADGVVVEVLSAPAAIDTDRELRNLGSGYAVSPVVEVPALPGGHRYRLVGGALTTESDPTVDDSRAKRRAALRQKLRQQLTLTAEDVNELVP